MTGEGIVVKTNGLQATVRIEKKSACSGECSSCGMCSNPVYDISAENTVNAAVGDTVKLYMATSAVFRAAFLVYMLPILGIFAVMGMCYIFTAPAVVTLISCAFVLVMWLVVIRRYNKNVKLENKIVEIVKKNP